MLTSLKNRKVVAAVRLKKRAFREQDRRFLVEGSQGVEEGLASQVGLLSMFSTKDLDPLVVRGRQLGVDVHEVSADVMAKLTSTVTPQGILAVAGFLDVALDSLPATGCIAILHEVRDPGNAGTVIRSADATGATGVVLTSASVDLYNSKTIRSSAGSVFHLPIVRGVDALSAIDHAKSSGFEVLAMAADGADDLYRTDLSTPVAFVFGNEAHGLSPEVVARADRTVRVPHAGKAESLNLAAAATVCLFEWARRRDAPHQALEHVIASAAHDIRSPLTAMKGFGYALEKRWDAMTEEQRAMMLQGIVFDADRMDTILRQLVDAARVLGGELEIFPERVNLSDLVVSIIQAQRRDPEHPEIVWAGQGATVTTDPARLKTALLAFIEALVWWGQEGPISIEATTSDGRLHVTVSRSGTDLRPEDTEPLFGPRRPGSGSGSKIGLFVTRAVARAQGGVAFAEVENGRLSFHLDIPAISHTV